MMREVNGGGNIEILYRNSRPYRPLTWSSVLTIACYAYALLTIPSSQCRYPPVAPIRVDNSSPVQIRVTQAYAL